MKASKRPGYPSDFTNRGFKPLEWKVVKPVSWNAHITEQFGATSLPGLYGRYLFCLGLKALKSQFATEKRFNLLYSVGRFNSVWIQHGQLFDFCLAHENLFPNGVRVIMYISYIATEYFKLLNEELNCELATHHRQFPYSISFIGKYFSAF